MIFVSPRPLYQRAVRRSEPFLSPPLTYSSLDTPNIISRNRVHLKERNNLVDEFSFSSVFKLLLQRTDNSRDGVSQTIKIQEIHFKAKNDRCLIFQKVQEDSLSIDSNSSTPRTGMG